MSSLFYSRLGNLYECPGLWADLRARFKRRCRKKRHVKGGSVVPPGNSIELTVGKLRGEMDASHEAHTECRTRFDKRLDSHSDKIDELRKQISHMKYWLFFVAGAGGASGSLLSKFLTGATVVADVVP